nr:PREDICTED: neutral and basic amino acid transport protein rBAT-like isoform X2 [Latimeria chalumnae]|eukprot:XP_014346030.1 PREDICTED: neutral and basic amino acid transport protein rBAT-like isoform X2 [Latimeria chalumnae]
MAVSLNQRDDENVSRAASDAVIPGLHDSFEIRFTGYTKAELMKMATTRKWTVARNILMTLSFLVWVGMLTVAVILIVRCPKCELYHETLWWQEGIIYHIVVKSFQDSDGDGFGDFRGIEQHIKYILNLKIKTVILGPVHKYVPDDDNATDLNSIDSIYGTVEDFRTLLTTARRNDIRIILDLTPNPNGIQKNKWFDKNYIDMKTEVLVAEAVGQWSNLTNIFSKSHKIRVLVLDTEEENLQNIMYLRESLQRDILISYYLTNLTENIDGNLASFSIARTVGMVEDRWLTWRLGGPAKGRINYTVPVDLKKLFAVLTFSLPGTPVIYYGEEIGLEDYRTPFKSSTPLMIWNTSANGGFSSGLPWIPIDLNVNTVSVMNQSADSESFLSFYRSLGSLRLSEPTFRFGNFRFLKNTTDYFVFERNLCYTHIIVVINFGEKRTVDFSAVGLPSHTTILLHSSAIHKSQVIEVNNLTIAANEGIILKYITNDSGLCFIR